MRKSVKPFCFWINTATMRASMATVVIIAFLAASVWRADIGRTFAEEQFEKGGLAFGTETGTSGIDGDLKRTTVIQTAQPETETLVRVSEAYAKLPLAFEANRGQVDSRVKFLSRGRGYTLFLASTEAVLTLQHPAIGKARKRGASGRAAASGRTSVIRMKVLGANDSAEVTGIDELPGKTNYFIGNDPAEWQTGVSNYSGVRYKDIYRGVDLVYHGNDQRQLEYDFVIAPGTDPSVIKLGFKGAKRLSLNKAGDLVLRVPGGSVIERAPVAYQEIGDERRFVAARYEIASSGKIGFEVGHYDHDRPLIIDPVLSYSTYLGGSGFDQADDVFVDASGSAYVSGGTCSANFPTQNTVQPLRGVCDAFVTKFSPAGDALVYSTFLGGDGLASSESAIGIAVDGSGSAYVTGRTCTANFPTVNPFQATLGGGDCDAFVTKLSPSGAAIQYSTYLGGTCRDGGFAIAVDATGSAYVTGETGTRTPSQTCPAANFPVANAFQSAQGGLKDAFLAKLAPAGNSLVYSTYLGGDQDDYALGLAIDGSGSVFVTGATLSTNFPTANAVQSTKNFGEDVFVTKFSSSGNALIYSTFLGGGAPDTGWDVALDDAGSAYVAGQTRSPNFPTANALQTTSGGSDDAFVTKLSPSGNSLVYSTYLGGNSIDTAYGVAVDSSGSAYITGWTFSGNFPRCNPVQAVKGSGLDAFVARLTPSGNAMSYSTYLGGTDASFSDHTDGAFAVAVDAMGNAHVVGIANATNFPTANAFQATKGGQSDAFLSKLMLVSTDTSCTFNPVASAGTDQTIDEGALVTLNGTSSTDPNGDTLTYFWEQIGGPPVTLSDSAAAQPTFTAPSVPSGGATLTFRLTVSDGIHTSEPDTVDITIRNVNQTPVADAGSDQTVQEGSPVTLHAASSFDPDGDPVSYQWTQTSGPPVTLSDPLAAEPVFTAPVVGADGSTLTFTVTVSDGVAQSTDVVQIIISNLNNAPIAEAGPDQTVDEATSVTLDGSASSDPDADTLTFSWVQLSGPDVTLLGGGTVNPTFTAPAVGAGGEILVFQLAVHDGSAASEPDTVTINVRDSNQPPACELARPSLSLLWPPNHKLIPIGITGVADANNDDVQITITGVTQDEPVDGLGDGDTSPDAVLGGSSVMLRSERSGQGTGRVYRIVFRAQDAGGATCNGTVNVCVPHTRGGSCTDEGQNYNSLVP